MIYRSGGRPPAVLDWAKVLDTFGGTLLAQRDAWRELRGSGQPVATIHNLSPIFAVGQTVFESAFGGDEVVCILERDPSAGAGSPRFEYKLLATSRTSTLEKELRVAGAAGFSIAGMTVGKTMAGGDELVAITRRRLD